MDAQEYIEYLKDTYPDLANITRGNDENLYNTGMLIENRQGISTEHIQPYETEKRKNEALGHSFLGNIGSYGIDFTNWDDAFKDAYNNSIIGIYEQAQTGELPYELTIDPKTGEPIDLNLLQKGASFVMSMFMPADIAAFWTGGKALGMIGSQISKRVFGKKLRDEVTKNLVKGYKAAGYLTRDAERMASRRASMLLTNPSKFVTRKPVYETFVDKKLKQEFSREIFSGENIADAWKLNANVIGGQLAAHRGLQEAVSIMYEKGQQNEQTGEWIPGELSQDDMPRIGQGMFKSYVTGVAVGGVKALAGTKVVDAWKGDDVLKGYTASAAEFGAESLVFGSVEPIMTGRLPTVEELKHSAFGLLSIKAAGASVSRISKAFHDNKLRRQMRNKDLEERVKFREDMINKTDNPQVKEVLKSDNIKDLKELKFNINNEFDYSFFSNFSEKMKKLEKELDNYGGDNYELVSRTFKDLGERDINIMIEGEFSKAKAFLDAAREKALEGGHKLSKEHIQLAEDIRHIEKYLTDYLKIKDQTVGKASSDSFENDVDIIETFLKPSTEGGASGSRNQLGPHVKQVYDSNNVPLYYDKHGQRTTDVAKGINGPVFEIKNDSSRQYLTELINKEQRKQRKMRHGKTIEDLYEDASFKIVNPKLESDIIQWVYDMDWGGSKNPNLAAENKKIIGSLLKKEASNRFPDDTAVRGKIKELHSFAKWLTENEGINLAGSGVSEGVLRNAFDKYLRTGKNGSSFAPSTWETKRTKINQFYKEGVLADYIGYNPIPGKTFKAPKEKFVSFLDNEAAAKAIETNLGKDRQGFAGPVSKKHNITNLEWSVFHRIMHEAKGRLADFRTGTDKHGEWYGVQVGNYNPNTRTLSYMSHKGKKSGRDRIEIDLSKNDALHFDLVELINTRSKGDFLFNNVHEYYRKTKGVKQGMLESLALAGEDAQVYIDFQKRIKLEGENYIEPGDVLKIGEAGTEGSSLRSIWRTAEHGWNVEQMRQDRQHTGWGTHEFYLKKAGLQARVKATQLKKTFKQNVAAGQSVYSKFIKDLKQNQVLTVENYNSIVKWFKKRNPGVEIETIKLGEGVAAKTTFKAMRDIISVELGKSDLTSLFHENMEILLKHAERSGDKKLLNLINKGIESTVKDARLEWKIRGGAKGTGYKDFNTYKKEYFMQKTGKFAANKFVETRLIKKISNWMKEMFVEFKRYFFGIESEKLSIEDYVMLVGRRGYKGVNVLADRNYVKSTGEVVYSKFASNKSKDDVQNARRYALKKLEKKAEESGVPTAELFKELRWKERFGVKSFGEITDRKTAAILLKDLEMKIDWDKINNPHLTESTIEYSSRFHKEAWKSKGGLLGYLKSGEFQQFLLNPFTIIEKYAHKNGEGRRFVETVLEPFNRDHQRNQGMLLELKEAIVNSGLKDKELDYISTYASEVHGTKLSKEAKLFLEKSKKDGTPQNLAVKNVKKFYDTWYNEILPKIIDQRFNRRIAQKLKKKLKDRQVKNYLTHSLNPKLKEFLLKEKEGETKLRQLVEENIIKDWESSKEFGNLMGRLNKTKKELRETRVKGTESEINALEQALDLIKTEIKESRDKIMTKEAIDKAYKDAVRQVEYSSDYVFNPNIDVKRYVTSEFTKIEDPLLRKKYGADKDGMIRTWDTTFDGTVVAYGQRMASFGALLKWAPEKLKFVKGKGLFEDSPLERQIDKVANSIEGSTYDKEAFKNYVNDVTNLMFGETSTSPKTVIGKRLMQMSRASAALGLSSPFSGAKNLLLWHSSIISILGVKAASEAWKGTLSSDAEFLAKQVGAKQVATRALAEVGLTRIPGTEKKFSITEIISKAGFMSPTEWSNRKMSIAASLYYAMDGFKKVSGKGTTWFQKTSSNTFIDKMKNEFKLTDDMIALGTKYGIESNNIPKTHKNYKELKSIQNEMRLRIAQYGHQITQGATGVANLPLWMNSTLLGKWGTVFQRIAYSMTTNMKRNVVDPLINHQNPLPLLRYGLSHIASGYVLWQLSDWILGQEAPHKSFKDDETYAEEFSRILEYAYRGEVGAGFSVLLSPMHKTGQDQSVLYGLLEKVGVVNLRNIENVATNTLSFLQGKKHFLQSAEDAIKGSMTLANHSLRLFYKQTSPYLTNHQNIRKSLNSYVKDNGLESDYAGGGVSLNENSPIFRKLRHSFMLGKAEGPDGYINTYWSAWYEFVHRELERNPGISLKEAKKSATRRLAGSIKKYNPLFFSEKSEKGKIHTDRYLNSLNPKFKAMVEKQIKEYKYRNRKFWRDINDNASRFDYK